MKLTGVLLWFSLTLIACSQPAEEKSIPKSETPSARFSVCNSADSLHAFTSGDTLIATGFIQPFTPAESGKGAGVKHFEYELQFADSSRIVLTVDSAYGKEPSFKTSEKYTVAGVYHVLPLHNNPCPPYCQNAAVPQLKLVEVYSVE